MKTGSLVAVPLALLVAGTALGQQPSAEDLFREGTLLFGRGETKAACERFAASYRIDVAPGTLFNLAACHEKEGLLWQARGEFLDFVDRATKAGKADKAKPAADRVAAIEQKLPRVALVFPPQSNVAAISFDGVPLAHELWDKPIPAEAGAHTIEFQAPGVVGATRSVTTGGDASVAKVDVPVLEPVPAAAPAAAAPVATSEVAMGAPSSAGGKPTRAIGFALAGAGVVALGVGAAFGVRTLGQKSDADGACGGSKGACPTVAQTQAAQKDLDGARTSALVSTVAFGVGIAAVGVGAYLVLTGGSHSEPVPAATARLHVSPTLGPDGGGLLLAGTF
jgi:hypothetical protein